MANTNNSVNNLLYSASSRRDTWVFPDNTLNCATDIQANRFYAIKALWYEIDVTGALVLRNNSSYGSNFYYTTANAAIMRANSTEQYVTFTTGSKVNVGTLTASASLRATATAVLRQFCIDNDFTGVELDTEIFSISGGATGTQYTNYKTWIKELGNDLHSYGLKLMQDAPPIWNSSTSGTPPEWNGRNSQAYYTFKYEDFNTLPVDYLLPLAYDYEFDLGAGYANQPITWMQDILQWAKSKITNWDRIIIGMPAAGYSGTTGGFTITGRTYDYLSVQTGFSTASRDSDSQELIWANGGISYSCIDEVAMLAKLQGAEQLGCGRVSMWYAAQNKYSIQRFQTVVPQALTLNPGQAVQLQKLSLGTATISGNALYVSGSGFSGGFAVDSSISPSASVNAYLANITGTIVEAASGTHNLLAGLFLGINTVTAGAATVTNASTLFIEGPMVATVSGTTYAIWSDSGTNRFNGAVQSETSIGYKTNAGGTVTQLTSKATTVILNKICGQITMNAAALAAGAEVAFTLTNSTIAATDVVIVNVGSIGTAGSYLVTVGAVAAGSCSITLSNASAGSLSQAVVLNFAVIKSVNA